MIRGAKLTQSRRTWPRPASRPVLVSPSPYALSRYTVHPVHNPRLSEYGFFQFKKTGNSSHTSQQHGLGEGSETFANREVRVRAYRDKVRPGTGREGGLGRVLAACLRSFTQPVMRGLARTFQLTNKQLLPIQQTIQMITKPVRQRQEGQSRISPPPGSKH